MTKKFKIIGKYIKDLSSETPEKFRKPIPEPIELACVSEKTNLNKVAFAPTPKNNAFNGSPSPTSPL